MVGKNGMKELGGAADKGVGNGWGEREWECKYVLELEEARCFSQMDQSSR